MIMSGLCLRMTVNMCLIVLEVQIPSALLFELSQGYSGLWLSIISSQHMDSLKGRNTRSTLVQFNLLITLICVESY